METRFNIVDRLARRLAVLAGCSALLAANVALSAELVVWHAYRAPLQFRSSIFLTSLLPAKMEPGSWQKEFNICSPMDSREWHQQMY